MILLYILISIIVLTTLYIHFNPEFGGSLSDENKSVNARSERWNGSVFRNYLPTGTDIGLSDVPKLIGKMFLYTNSRYPINALEVVEFDHERWDDNDVVSKFIWYGHSVIFFKINGKNILIDPMFGPDASSITPLATKRFSADTLTITDHLPDLDVVVFTHDHYDHLDYKSIKRIKDRVSLFIVPLGFSMHLIKWGVKKESIIEMDWYEEADIDGVKYTFTPSRHYSGRALFDRAKSLWGGWIIQYDDQKIYISGDGGYGPHFKVIGEKYGPFDLSFIECGQYNRLWKEIHLHPHESVKVIGDVKSEFSIPIHWGSFVLAHHEWNEPPELFATEAAKENQDYGFPIMGRIYSMDGLPSKDHWF